MPFVRIPDWDEFRDKEPTDLERVSMAALQFHEVETVNCVLVGADGFVRFGNVPMIDNETPVPVVFTPKMRWTSFVGFDKTDSSDDAVERREFHLSEEVCGLFVYREV